MFFSRFFYLFLLISSFAGVAGASGSNYISREEFEVFKADFVQSGCNIDGVLSSAKRLNVSDVYDDGGGFKPLISSLSKPALCLISRSSEFDVDYEVMTSKGVVQKNLENKFPDKGNVIKVMFRLPFNVSKKCADDGTIAFAVFFRKKDGKLQREITLNSDLLECNQSIINIPKKFR